MIRRLFKSLTGGEFVYREPLKHSCSLPSNGIFRQSHRGDIWKCKCGKMYKCKGLSWTGAMVWSLIDEIPDKDESEPLSILWRL